ncbi:B12-binding domain-containing radical SAM protein [Geosporobacter ferrireducens]|uniref:B12-binding domain-containing radical SAM protein n=1 Tax=Geosporobacter ferrireducens TaxID=1424294 RepID=A0A1D8GIM4_9FIRM|nr:radical SAM protein [Geosporobacter ferrireducens]AOT70766.1 B12-binding domain-containing radical SAM protein [Geosporobacter ferrireducens]
MKKLLLIQSTPYDGDRKLIKKKKLYFVGLGLPLLAALTPEDWQVEIILETIEDIPFDTDADLIAIGSMGHAVIRSIDIATEFKRRGKTVIMGGYMVSLMAEEAKQYCDSVVIGDAEKIWKRLLRDYETNNLKDFYREELTALSTPPPRFDLIVEKNIGDFLPVQAGRGCPNSCSFCSVYCLYKNRYLKRDIAEVVRDIRQVKELGFRKFLLLDDNIVSDREYLMALCKEIKSLGMEWTSQCSITIGEDSELLQWVAESGCTALSFGLESISAESLQCMDKAWAKPARYAELIKNIQEAGIDISTEMVVGADGDTLQSIKETARFIEANKVVVPRFYILTPIPGTKYYDKMKDENRICNEDMYSYNGSEAVHIPKNMSPEKLTRAYWELYNEVFSFVSIFKRTILRKEFLKKKDRYLFYFLVNLYYRYQIKRKITPNII